VSVNSIREVIMKNISKWRSANTGKALVRLSSVLVLGSAPQTAFDGFYAGGSIGYMNQNTSIDAHQNPASRNADIYKSTVGRGLPTAELFWGWGKVLGGSFYGGLEGKVDWVAGGVKKVSEDINFIYLSGRKGLGMALLARFGYLVSPHTLIYGGVGVKATRFGYNLFEKADKIPAPFSARSLNLLTEAGVETFLNPQKNLALRLSYSFMPTKGMTRTTASFPEGHMYRRHGIFKSNISEHIIKTGLIYRF